MSGPKRQPVPFGDYLLLDRINIGGMAEIWRGKKFEPGGGSKLVAIKRILPNIAEDEEFITMFIDEAKISVQLTHANIGKIEDLGQIAGSYFITMEYIQGKDLRAIFDRCRKRGEPAPTPLTSYVFAKVCEGLDHAHRKADARGQPMNVVHRDVSPQNVLISYEGDVKVIDFGIAKAAGKASKTQAGILKGKFAYMSPEQVEGLEIDRRSDVFAIGICLYELLTNERLFVGETDYEVLEKVRRAEVRAPSTVNPAVPDALDRIVLKALSRGLADRYQNASEMGDDLQHFLFSLDEVFGRKELSRYMQEAFAPELERERERLSEYAAIARPNGEASSGPSSRQPSGSHPVTKRPTSGSGLRRPASPPVGQVPTQEEVVVEPPLPAARSYADAEEPKTELGLGGGLEGKVPRGPLSASAFSRAVTDENPLFKAGRGAAQASAGLAPPRGEAWGAGLAWPMLFVGLLALLAGAGSYGYRANLFGANLLVDVPGELRGKVRVELNGRDLGDPGALTWPLFEKIRLGKNRVTFRADGYETFTDSAVATWRSPTVRLTPSLRKTFETGQLFLISEPEGADFQVNGEPLKRGGGREAVLVREVPVGRMILVEAKHPGFRPFQKKLMVEDPRSPVRLFARLEPEDVAVSVTSRPPGAEVYVNGALRGVTPSSLNLAPGDTEVVLQKRCYAMQKVPVSALVGSARTVIATLKKLPGPCR